MDLNATMRGSLDQIQVRDPGVTESAIAGELNRAGELTEVVFARLARLEDVLGPVRCSIPRDLLATSDPVAPRSPIADTLRAHNDSLEAIVTRIDQLLADVDL